MTTPSGASAPALAHLSLRFGGGAPRRPRHGLPFVYARPSPLRGSALAAPLSFFFLPYFFFLSFFGSFFLSFFFKGSKELLIQLKPACQPVIHFIRKLFYVHVVDIYNAYRIPTKRLELIILIMYYLLSS